MAPAKNVLKPTVRIVLAIVILACTAWVARSYWIKRQLILAENQAVELQNQEQYAQAVTAYEALLPKTTGEQAQRLRRNAVLCYAAMAEAPSLNLSDSLELYRKAYALDPAAVTNPAILKRLQNPK